MKDINNKLYQFCNEMWPLNRSITGTGVRETLQLIKKKIPNLFLLQLLQIR